MSNLEFNGLVIYSKDHREKDKLVKIFTRESGKKMFFVRGLKRNNHPLKSSMLSFTYGTYLGTINEDGLSFVNASKEIRHFNTIQNDIFLNAYGTYLIMLVDAVLEDNIANPKLYDQLLLGLTMINEGSDSEIIANIFEIKLLPLFGVAPEWRGCMVCGEVNGQFDYAPSHHGLLCQKHQHESKNRYHGDPKAIHLIRHFSVIKLDVLNTIEVSPNTKKEIRRIIDMLYDEYVGLHLKSKHFIDQMSSWQNILLDNNEDTGKK